MSKKIGWIGLGRMGEAMVTKLLKAGHAVHVEPHRLQGRAPGGAPRSKAQDRPRELLILFYTMVSTTDDFKGSALGALVVTGARNPRWWWTVPSISQEGSARFRAAGSKAWVWAICAPGSRAMPRWPQGGQAAHGCVGLKALYEQVEPYLQAMARHVGRGGAYFSGVSRTTPTSCHHPEPVRDAHALAEKAGIPRNVFLESIRLGAGFHVHALQAPVLSNLNFDQVTFTPKLLLKDTDLDRERGQSPWRAHALGGAPRAESIVRPRP